MSSSEEDELVEVFGGFVEESIEALDHCEPLLVRLNGSSGVPDPAVVGDVYRLFHGMKGTAGFLQLHVLVRITHLAETVLGRVREGHLAGSAELADVLVRTCDVLRHRIEVAATTFADAPETETDRSIMADLDAFTGARAPSAPAPSASHPPVSQERSQSATAAVAPVERPATERVPPARTASSTVTARDETPVPAPEPERLRPPEWLVSLTSRVAVKAPPARKSSRKKPREERAEAAPAAVAQAASLRVDVTKLDALMDLVGEMIIASTSVAHHPVVADERYEDLHKSVAQLSRVVRSLQDVAMSLRMVPIEPTFKKMVRLVHDVSSKQGKKANLEIIGADTEVDKMVADLIGNPLVHLLRNAVDHGLETPEARLTAGKPDVGTLRLSAYHHAGEVFIRVEDDGRGLDREKIGEKAVSKGLVERGRLAAMRDDEVWNFIFAPGFSTAAEITDISGRGVGMDAVKQNIEAMKGRVDIRSTPGRGSTFTLRIPLTLAVVDGLLVRVGDSVFTIPLPGIRESVVVGERDITRLADGEELVRIRDELVPVLRLHRHFHLEAEAEALHRGVLVVTEDGGTALGLFADELVGQRQTVIKPLGAFLGDVAGVAGCTIFDDGRLSLILDVPGLLAAKIGAQPSQGARA